MMIVGAACGFGGAWLTGSTIIGAICGIVAGTLLSLIFALMTLGLAVNQVATGLALTILGVGLSGLFGEDAFIYLSLALVVGVYLFLYHTKAGLVLRAAGDNHVSAHALGYPVLR